MGMHGLFSRIGAIALRANLLNGKEGTIFFNSTEGAIKKLVIARKDPPVIVDNNNILAYTSGLSSQTVIPGGFTSFLYSGEGSAIQFQGEGTVFIGSIRSEHYKQEASEVNSCCQ